jgi:hypothetical protein
MTLLSFFCFLNWMVSFAFSRRRAMMLCGASVPVPVSGIRGAGMGDAGVGWGSGWTVPCGVWGGAGIVIPASEPESMFADSGVFVGVGEGAGVSISGTSADTSKLGVSGAGSDSGNGSFLPI